MHTQWLFLVLLVGDIASAVFGQETRISRKHKDQFMKTARMDRNHGGLEAEVHCNDSNKSVDYQAGPEPL